MVNLGTVRPGRTIYVPFASFASSTGASITLSGLATSDIKVYKNGSTTERSSTSGFTLLDTDGTDFDALTGIHGFSIDLSDNTDAGFYAAGATYFIVVSSVTVDSQTVSFVAGWFRIGYDAAVLNTTIATLSSQTSFTLTSGPAEDDAINGMWIVFHDVASAVQQAWGQVLDYTGSTKTVTLAAAPTFTIAATDNVCIMGPMPLQPATTGSTLTVASGKAAATIAAGDLANGAITAAVIATDAIDNDAIAANAVTEIQSGLATAASIAALNNLSAANVSDAVWNAATASYGSAGTYGLLVETNLDAAVSTRLASASYTAPLDAAGTRSAVGLASANLDTQLSAIAGYIDTEVGTAVSQTTAAAIRSAVGLASANLDTQLDALPTAVENADALLGRNVAGGSSTGRTVSQALYFLRNKWTISGGTLTVYATDDTTSSWTASITTTPGNPVTSSDPA